MPEAPFLLTRSPGYLTCEGLHRSEAGASGCEKRRRALNLCSTAGSDVEPADRSPILLVTAFLGRRPSPYGPARRKKVLAGSVPWGMEKSDPKLFADAVSPS